MAAKKKPEAVVEVLDPEVALVQVEGKELTGFLTGMVAFFRRATELEVLSKQFLEGAEAMPVPKTVEEDGAVQVYIRKTAELRKTALEHWSITSVASKLHKRLVACRKRSEEPLDRALLLCNARHNDYVTEERRRAAEKQDKVRREAETKAQQDRDAELKRMETAAVAKEEAAADLSDRERDFVDAFVFSGDPGRSAKHAGFLGPEVMALRLLGRDKIKVAIEAKRAAAVIRAQAEAVKQQPISAQVETVLPKLTTVGGHDRDSWSGEVLDEPALIAAVIGGKHGIPWDVLTVHKVNLNRYAVSMHELMDRWPGVKAKKKTSLVG